jgi:uncharacterized protein YjbJ (UPF0337 family)
VQPSDSRAATPRPKSGGGGTRFAPLFLGALVPLDGGHVNWDRIEGNWKQLKGKVRQTWAEITDDDFDRIAGKKDELVGKLQEKKGIARDEAEREVQEWSRTLDV